MVRCHIFLCIFLKILWQLKKTTLMEDNLNGRLHKLVETVQYEQNLLDDNCRSTLVKLTIIFYYIEDNIHGRWTKQPTISPNLLELTQKGKQTRAWAWHSSAPNKNLSTINNIRGNLWKQHKINFLFYLSYHIKMNMIAYIIKCYLKCIPPHVILRLFLLQ